MTSLQASTLVALLYVDRHKSWKLNVVKSLVVTATDRGFAVLKGNSMMKEYALPISRRLKLTDVPTLATSRGV